MAWLARGYGESSTVNLALGTVVSAPNYTYNQAAARFFHVQMELTYITESTPARMSHIDRVDDYTRADSYEFILEADRTGKVLGGEWLDASRRSHPDFVWWPSGAPQSPGLHGLTYAMVKALLEQAKAAKP